MTALLFIGWLSYTYFFSPVPLAGLNAGYAYTSKEMIIGFFSIYPWLNMAAIGLFFLNRKMALPLMLLLLFAYMLFYALPLFNADCPSCMNAGLLPSYSIEKQALFCFIALAGAVTAYLLAPAGKKALK